VLRRPARIAGWVPVAWSAAKAGGRPLVGGLTDLSRTGARLYLTWNVSVGEVLSLGLRLPQRKTPLRMPCRIVWVKQDKPGSVEHFEARLHLLRELVRLGYAARGMTYGWAAGARWEPGVDQAGIRELQQRFEREDVRLRKRAVGEVRFPDLETPVLDIRRAGR
jgi:hypothetical protein